MRVPARLRADRRARRRDRAGAREDPARKCYEQYCVPVEGQADILISGIPYISPYNVNSKALNPLLVQVMALGYFFHMYRQQAAPEEGRRHDRHAPVLRSVRSGAPPVLHRVLQPPPARDARRLHARDRSTRTSSPTTRRYVEMYRRGNAYHGAHPFYMWYWGQRGREHLRQGDRRRRDNATVPELLGWERAEHARRGDRDGARAHGPLGADHDAAPPADPDDRRPLSMSASIEPPTEARCSTSPRRCAASGSCSSARPASSARSRCRCCCAATPTSASCSCWCGRAPARRRKSASSRRSPPRRSSIRSARRWGDGTEAFLREKMRAARRRRGAPAAATSREADLEQARQARRHHQLRRPGLVQPVARDARCASTCSGPSTCSRSRARPAPRWSTSRPASSPATATARSGRTSRSSATSRARIAATARRTDTLRDDDFSRRGRDRRLPAHHRSGQSARRRSRARLGVPRQGRRAPARRRARRRRRAHAQDRRAARAQDLDGRGADRARHGARAALGLAQHVHVHQVARRAGVRRRAEGRRARVHRAARRSSSRRCAIRSPAGTRASPPPRRWRSSSIKGHRTYPAGDKATLDIIPVDLVAVGPDHGDGGDHRRRERARLSARLLRREPALHEARRRAARPAQAALLHASARDEGEGNALLNRALARLEPVAVSRERFDQTSAPLWKAAGRRS